MRTFLFTERFLFARSARTILVGMAGISAPLYLLFYISLTAGVDAKFYHNNFTDFQKCKVHYSRSEIKYTQFYEIPDTDRTEDLLLDFHFSVLSRSDAHILLSSTATLTRETPVYEIVLGAGGNSFSDIRRMQKSDVRTTKRISILSSVDIKSFWVHINKDGLVEVGEEGDDLAFLSWKDPEPLELKYFSFCTWSGVEAKWFFDCPLQNNVTSDSEEIEPVLTDLERLRKDLLSSYNPYVRPAYGVDTITSVDLKFLSFVISLDERKSVLDFKGEASLEWIDEKLNWIPEEYGGITDLHFVVREIWRPDLKILNAVNVNEDLFASKFLVVRSTGEAYWKAVFRTKVFCDISDLKHWPADIHTCTIQFGFQREQDFLNLEYNNGRDDFNQMTSSWKILKITSQKAINQTNLPLSEPILKFNIEMQRYPSAYSAIYYSPFIVIAFIQLATFLVSPGGHTKITLACFQILLTTIVITRLLNEAPSSADASPYLVQLYSYSYVAVTVSLGISIIVINLSRNEYSLTAPRFLQSVVTSKALRLALFLPDMKVGNEYGKIHEVSIRRGIKNMWTLLGVLIDRVCLLIYFGLICLAVGSNY